MKRACLMLFVAAAMPHIAGCSVFVGGSDAVVTGGDRYESGSSTYDDFFDALHEARADAEQLPIKSRDPARALATKLELPNGASDEAILDATKERAQALLKESGVRLHLRLAPQPELVELPKGKAAAIKGAKWREVVQTSAASSIEVADEMFTLYRRLEDLERERRELLEKAEGSSPDAGKASLSDIQRELIAAEGVLEDARRRAGVGMAFSARFAIKLAMAVETGGFEAPPAPAPAAPPPAPKPAWQPRPPVPKPPPADFDP